MLFVLIMLKIEDFLKYFFALEFHCLVALGLDALGLIKK